MEKLSLEELQPLILDWAREKNLLFEENAPKQYLKLVEECGETAHAILKNDIEKIKDGLGDIFVVLVIYFEQTKQNIDFNFVEPDNVFEHGVMLYSILGFAMQEFNENNPFEWLNDLCLSLNLDLTECANLAWNEIKDRKGKTVNGTFIKN